MKERKKHQVRVRLTESQVKRLVEYLVEHPEEFKTQSELIRESISKQISRRRHTIPNNKRIL